MNIVLPVRIGYGDTQKMAVLIHWFSYASASVRGVVKGKVTGLEWSLDIFILNKVLSDADRDCHGPHFKNRCTNPSIYQIPRPNFLNDAERALILKEREIRLCCLIRYCGKPRESILNCQIFNLTLVLTELDTREVWRSDGLGVEWERENAEFSSSSYVICPCSCMCTYGYACICM